MAKILLYGEIGWEVTSKEVVTWLQEHGGEPIEMHVNSPGGDVFEAIAIRSAVLACDDVTIVVDALAASAAAVISLCGKPLKMAEYSRLMIHSASSYVYGNSKQVEEQLDMLNSIDDDLAEMIAGKIGKTAEEVREAYFDGKDHWLEASECIDMGIAEKAEAKGTEDRLAAVYDCLNGRTDGMHSTNPIKPNNDMDMTKIQAVAAFKDCSTEDEVVAKAQEQSDELEAKNAEIDEKNKRIAELEAEVESFKKEKEEAQAQADEKEIADALESGRISQAQAGIYRDLIKSDRENALKMLASIPAPADPARVADFIKGEGDLPKKSYFQSEMDEIAKRK